MGQALGIIYFILVKETEKRAMPTGLFLRGPVEGSWDDSYALCCWRAMGAFS
jgi:hypothetical protein